MFFAFLAAVSFTLSAEGGSGSPTAQKKGFDKNDISSVREYAEKGSPEAQYYLGLHCEIENNMEEAATWYRKAAVQNDLDAQYKLGLCYDKGEGVPQDSKEAVKWYQKAAEHGIVEAQINLGVCYENGSGIPKSIPEAVKWYREAADGRSTEAQYKLGFCYENYGEVRNYDKAASWYRRAAERGNPQAQYAIGRFYETGKGVDKNALEAVSWFTKAAKQGNPDASVRLGQLYESGAEGVPRDMSAAVKWYKKAAEDGYEDAQFLYRLGTIFESSEDIGINITEAIYWYTKAAEHGSAQATQKLNHYTEQQRQEIKRKEQKQQEEAARKAKERQKEEAVRKAREEAARKADEKLRQEETARRNMEEATRILEKELAARKEAERKAEERRRKEEAARKAREEAERKVREAEAVRKAAAELVKMSVKMSDEKTTVVLPDGSTLDMNMVKAGSFEMSAGDLENKPDEIPHKVTLKRDFYIGQTEVTQAQWVAVMGFNPSCFKGDDRPVDQVSWNDAMQFCENLNNSGKAPNGWRFSLPTETQWEYAARGGQKSKGYRFSGSNDIGRVAWYRLALDVETQPVGQKLANELGLFDMSGNVWEWCLDDWKDKSDKQTPEFWRKRESDTDNTNRVERGGSWYCVEVYCRCSGIRYFHGANERIYDLGFRVALVPAKY